MSQSIDFVILNACSQKRSAKEIACLRSKLEPVLIFSLMIITTMNRDSEMN